MHWQQYLQRVYEILIKSFANLLSFRRCCTVALPSPYGKAHAGLNDTYKCRTHHHHLQRQEVIRMRIMAPIRRIAPNMKNDRLVPPIVRYINNILFVHQYAHFYAYAERYKSPKLVFSTRLESSSFNFGERTALCTVHAAKCESKIEACRSHQLPFV